MDTFYALAAPRRRKIVELLARNSQLTATQICNEFDVTAQAISQHLRVLLDAKIVVVERRAQNRNYALNPASISELGEWADHIEALWSARLDRLSVILGEHDGIKNK